MNQFFQKLITSSLFIALLASSGLTAQAEESTQQEESVTIFTDLSTEHANYEAIEALKKAHILDGYPDGTFKPDNEVNRAEFLKIILEGSFISLNSSIPLPFDDIDSEEWYYPYVQKAFAEGWVVGYEDETFRPEQSISKAEALKIIGEVQNWQINQNPLEKPFSDVFITAWYTPYISYAKENGFLEENGDKFSPQTPATRAGISENIYRTLSEETLASIAENAQNPTTEAEEEIEGSSEEKEIEFLEIEDGDEISTTFFKEIKLDQSMPGKIFKNEIYYVEGIVDAPKIYQEATLILDGVNNDYYKTYTVQLDGVHFSIPLIFNQTGSYYIGIIPGDDGKSKAAEISVVSGIPTFGALEGPKVKSLDLNFENDTTYIDIDAPDQAYRKFTFTQGEKTHTYFSRQGFKERYPVSYMDFADFEEGEISLHAALAYDDTLWRESDPITFMVSAHHFTENESTEISVTPNEVISSGSNISINGKALTDIKQDAYVIKPNGFVDTVRLSTGDATSSYFGQDIIKSGGNFSFKYNPGEDGVYIIEINNKKGIPVLNHPIYVGNNIIPLIPDYFDLNQRSLFDNELDLEASREELLNLINESREAHGLKAIKLASDLNNLAQSHSDDMAAKNYFSHINLNNQTPEDRRISAKILTPVSENIAKDVSVPFAHEGLMRSAAHRINILGTDWSRVGLGIAEKNGYLYITEEFSTDKLTQNDLNLMKSQLYNEIDDLREENGLGKFTVKTSLENAADYMNDKSIDEGASLNNVLLSEALQNNSVSGSATAILRNFYKWNSIVDSIIEGEDTLLESTWKAIGIDLNLDKIGNIQLILILNNP